MRFRRLRLSLCLLATISSTACLSPRIIIGAPPPCPEWTEEGKAQLREAIKWYPALETEMGRYVLYCEGIDAMRR